MLFSISALANSKFAQEEDSLKLILSKHSDPRVIIPVLYRLSKLNEQQPEEVLFLKRQYEAAMKIDSMPVAYMSLMALTRHYYNGGVRDSILYWGELLDSIACSRSEYPDELFDVKSYSCQDLLWRENYEQAMNDAMDQYRLASRENQLYGLVRCSESLGLIYRAVRRDSDAVQSFQEGLSILNGMEGRLETQMRMTCYQVESSLRTTHHEKTKSMLTHYKEFIDKQKELNKNTGDVYPVDREYWLLYSFYTDLYLSENNLAEAKQALEMAAVYEGNIFAEGDFVENVYLFVQARYYRKIGNASLALFYIDELLKQDPLPDELMLKADILKEQGKINEALLLYDKIFEIKSQKSSDTFLRQINQLRTLHEINSKEMQTRELQIKNQQMKLKQHQLIFSMLIVVILLVLLYIMYVYIRRTQILKNEMQKEKDSLLSSEEKLIKEKNRAEEASRMKSAFVANMSHEIRTPLNAIVGFSGLLIDDSTESDEKEEYASIIKNNTGLLLNLVNDVLDLSRMETGDLNFKFDYYPLIECCQNAFDSIRCRMTEDVEFTFTPAPESIIVYTDALRLQQLLTNLLTNSIKFTQKGEINLSYVLEEDRKTVLLSVTDTGYGIPLEKQADIFKRFEKLDDYKPGAGLGLSICSIIAERLGGSLSIDSCYTTGARFFFTHPCEIVDEAYNQGTTKTK